MLFVVSFVDCEGNEIEEEIRAMDYAEAEELAEEIAWENGYDSEFEISHFWNKED